MTKLKMINSGGDFLTYLRTDKDKRRQRTGEFSAAESTDWGTGRGSGRDWIRISLSQAYRQKILFCLSLMKSAFFSFFSLPLKLETLPGFTIPHVKKMRLWDNMENWWTRGLVLFILMTNVWFELFRQIEFYLREVAFLHFRTARQKQMINWDN